MQSHYLGDNYDTDSHEIWRIYAKAIYPMTVLVRST